MAKSTRIIRILTMPSCESCTAVRPDLRSAQIQKTAPDRSPPHPSRSSDFTCQAGRLQQTSGAEGWDDWG